MSSASQRHIPVRICNGGSEDLDAVLEVMSGAFSPDFGEGWTRSQVAGILPLSGVGLAIARDEGNRALGFSLQRTISGESELLLLAVHHSAQRCGIGSRLLDHFIETGRSLGAARLHLEVRDGNTATAMYQAYGFSPVGRRTNYYRGLDGRVFDAITMALDAD